MPKWATVQFVSGCIPVALSKSEGAGSVWTLVHLPGAHLQKQVLGNEIARRLPRGPPLNLKTKEN